MRADDFDSQRSTESLCSAFVWFVWFIWFGVLFFLTMCFFSNSVFCFFAVIQAEDDEKEMQPSYLLILSIE